MLVKLLHQTCVCDDLSPLYLYEHNSVQCYYTNTGLRAKLPTLLVDSGRLGVA